MGICILNKFAERIQAEGKKIIQKYRDKKERDKLHYVKLITITQDKPDDNSPLEYHAHATEVPILDLPREARHITGHKGYYCLVDFEPEYISYRQAEIVTTEEGEEIVTNQYNVMTAIDYWAYSRDSRIDKGFEAVGNLSASTLGNIDLKKLLVIGIVAVVTIYMITHMS